MGKWISNKVTFLFSGVGATVLAALVFQGSGDDRSANESLSKIVAEVENTIRDEVKAGIDQLAEGFEEIVEPGPGNPGDWNQLGLMQISRNETDTAIRSFERAIALGNRTNDQPGIAEASGNLGVIYWLRSDLGLAEGMLRNALNIYASLDRSEGMAVNYGNLGRVYFDRGDHQRAEEMHGKALVIEIELGNREGIAVQYSDLALVYLEQRNLAGACEM